MDQIKFSFPHLVQFKYTSVYYESTAMRFTATYLKSTTDLRIFAIRFPL